MKKNFKGWHKKKTQLNSKISAEVYFYEKEIWWVAIGHNVRFEQDGKGPEFARPVIVFRKFNEYLFIGVPLSSTKKRGRYYQVFSYKPGVTSVALLSQLRAYDSNRLIDKNGVLDNKTYRLIQARITRIIAKRPKK